MKLSTNLSQVYEETLEKFKNEKQRKAQIWNELEKQKNLNKPLHDKKEKAAAIEKEFSMKVKMKVREKLCPVRCFHWVFSSVTVNRTKCA